MLFDDVRYFFYITNDRHAAAADIVFGCNDRCDQENLIAQLAGGVRALAAAVDNLLSNAAYMLMTSLAWTLKSWAALLLPVKPRWREQHETERRTLLTMEFKTFLNALVNIPCQIVKQSRRVIHRVLSWNPHLPSSGYAPRCVADAAARQAGKPLAPRASPASGRRAPLPHPPTRLTSP